MASISQIVTENFLSFAGEKMVYSEGISRLEYAQRFGELYGREPTWQNFSYGKVHNLSEIVEFLVMLTKGAITKDQESNPGEHLLLKNRPLCEWKAVEWKGFRSRLNTIQMSLLRCDASASIDDIYRGDSENSAIDESRSQNKWFTTRLIRVLDLLTLHETLAPFRQVLENMSTVSGDEALLPMSLPKELAEQFIETIDIIDGGSEEQTRLLQKAFCSLLKNERTNTFHSPATMRRIFDDPTRNYSFTRLFNRVDKLIRQWVSIVFKEPIAIDTDVSNAARAPNSTGAVESENEGAQARALKRLQRSRARLKDRVTDPLAEAVFVANRARGNRKRKQRNHIPYDDDDDDDEDDEILEDTDEMYKKYFGERTWNGISELRASMAQHSQNIETVRSSLHRSIGPSSDMLQPVVTVKSISREHQSILLAKGWKLGRWEEVGIQHNEIHPDPVMLRDNVHHQHQHQPQVGAHNHHNATPKKTRLHRNVTPKKKGSSPFSRTMSVPNLSRISEIDNKPMVDDPPLRENMEESMTFLKKLFSHQQEGGITFPTTLLSPPDSRILINQRLSPDDKKDTSPYGSSMDYSPGRRHKSESNELRSSEVVVQTPSVQNYDEKSLYLDELEETHQLCLHNAEISKNCNEAEKENIWNLLAETALALTEMNEDGKDFNGWGGKGGGALGIDMINNFFDYYEALGDVQMLATMFCVLKGRKTNDQSIKRPCLLPHSREKIYDTYIIRYGELLYSWGLLNTRAELNKHLRRKYEQTDFQIQSTEDMKEERFDLGVAMSCPDVTMKSIQGRTIATAVEILHSDALFVTLQYAVFSPSAKCVNTVGIFAI
eukprot:CAMPEP_0168225936 /NCGR_PEP_ID=MMETSP0140_2-20121125/13081_1 /TAXON_ID=44445 /ORGANISM="Pseudo-nitzschia australis, Strain 10249 10 AB" /LENGTH=832 /DNA_ID=CAMNT_0008156861 /DNA_START=25 /DNA_END=2524 /DNA_ORIENTATION=+